MIKFNFIENSLIVKKSKTWEIVLEFTKNASHNIN